MTDQHQSPARIHPNWFRPRTTSGKTVVRLEGEYDARDAKVVELYLESDASMSSIARQFNVSTSRIRAIVIARVPPEQRRMAKMREVHRQIHEGRLAGLSYRALADRFDMSEAAVRMAARSAAQRAAKRDQCG